MSWPSTRTLPDVALTMPQTMLMSVVLPAPFGPSSAKISPRRISRSTSTSARKPVAYVFDSFATEMMDAVKSFTPGCLYALSSGADAVTATHLKLVSGPMVILRDPGSGPSSGLASASGYVSSTAGA